MTAFDFAALQEIFGDRKDVIDGVLRLYGQAVGADVAALKTALQNKDIKAAETVAHRAKGAAMIVGADDIADICAGIEAAARNGDWQMIKEKIAIFRSAAQAVRAMTGD